MKKLIITVLFLLAGDLWAQDPTQKLNIPDACGWDKPERFTITDRIWPADHGQADVCMYEDDAMGAVCFSVDDDYVGEHVWWLNTMERYGWTMTWFLIVAYVEDGSQGFHGNWDVWRNIASKGHQVQSHTWSHGHCNDPFSGYTTLGCPAILEDGNCCDPDTEYARAQRLIRENIPGDDCWTMAYSGHQVEDRTADVAGTTFTYDSYAHDYTVASKYYIGSRGTGGRPNLANRAYYMNTSTGDISQEWVDHLITKTTQPLYWRGWMAEFWHSHGDTAALVEKFDYVKAQETAGNIWVGTFEELLKYTQSWVTRNLTVLDVTDSMVAFTLSDSMLDSVYTYPLTVKVRVNNDWDTVLAFQNGLPVGARLISHESNMYALVKAVPDGGEVQITKGSGTVITKVKDPVISPDGGSHTGRTAVTITTATPGATLYYTTDGNDPTSASTEYTGAFDLTASATVKAIGIMSGKDNSNITTAVFTIIPDTTPPSIISAEAADDPNLITVLFSEKIDPSDVTAGNFSVTGGITVQGAALGMDGLTVSLTVTALTVDQAYTVTAASVSDLAVSPNTASGLQAVFTYTESQALEGQTAYWSMNTVNGDTVPDEIGSNTGIMYNVDWTANGHDGGALYFNGYDTLDVGTGDFGADATHDVSISLWFKADALGGYLVEKGAYVRPYHLQIYSGKLRSIVRTGGTNYITGTTSLQTGTWYHAVLTVDSTDATLYLNNAVEKTYALSGVMDNGTGNYTRIGTGFDGTIDEVRIWDRSLNAAEVDALYNYGGTTGVIRRLPDTKRYLPVSGPVYYNCRGERMYDIHTHSGVYFRVSGGTVTRIISIR